MKLINTLLNEGEDAKGQRNPQTVFKFANEMAHVVSKRIGMSGSGGKGMPDAKKKAISAAKTLLADVERELLKMIEREIK